MEQRDLGRTGLKVSALGYGCGSVGGLMVRGDPAEQKRAVARALEAGITYFDTAPSYGDGRSEENLGRVLRELKAWDRVVVGTKVRLGPAELDDPLGGIRRSLQQSLRLLDRDSVDLLQLHNHVLARAGDADGIPVEQVVGNVAEGLRQMVRDGLVRHVGFTGLGDASALREAVLSERFDTVQCYFNLANPSAGFKGASGGEQDLDGLIDTAAREGLGVIVIRALAAGALSGQTERPANAGDPGDGMLVRGAAYAADLERSRPLVPLAREAGLEGTLELAVRFALSKPGVSTVLVGYSNFEHLESAIRWTERGPLPDDVVERVVHGSE